MLNKKLNLFHNLFVIFCMVFINQLSAVASNATKEMTRTMQEIIGDNSKIVFRHSFDESTYEFKGYTLSGAKLKPVDFSKMDIEEKLKYKNNTQNSLKDFYCIELHPLFRPTRHYKHYDVTHEQYIIDITPIVKNKKALVKEEKLSLLPTLPNSSTGSRSVSEGTGYSIGYNVGFFDTVFTGGYSENFSISNSTTISIPDIEIKNESSTATSTASWIFELSRNATNTQLSPVVQAIWEIDPQVREGEDKIEFAINFIARGYLTNKNIPDKKVNFLIENGKIDFFSFSELQVPLWLSYRQVSGRVKTYGTFSPWKIEKVPNQVNNYSLRSLECNEYMRSYSGAPYVTSYTQNGEDTKGNFSLETSFIFPSRNLEYINQEDIQETSNDILFEYSESVYKIKHEDKFVKLKTLTPNNELGGLFDYVLLTENLKEATNFYIQKSQYMNGFYIYLNGIPDSWLRIEKLAVASHNYIISGTKPGEKIRDIMTPDHPQHLSHDTMRDGIWLFDKKINGKYSIFNAYNNLHIGLCENYLHVQQEKDDEGKFSFYAEETVFPITLSRVRFNSSNYLSLPKIAQDSEFEFNPSKEDSTLFYCVHLNDETVAFRVINELDVNETIKNLRRDPNRGSKVAINLTVSNN